MNNKTRGVTMLEQHTHKFWLASKAWYREEGFVEGWSAGKLIDVLAELAETRANCLARQAQALMMQSVNGKLRRAKLAKGKNIVHLELERTKRLSTSKLQPSSPTVNMPLAASR